MGPAHSSGPRFGTLGRLKHSALPVLLQLQIHFCAATESEFMGTCKYRLRDRPIMTTEAYICNYSRQAVVQDFAAA